MKKGRLCLRVELRSLKVHSVIHSFIHPLFNNYLLRTHSVPGTAPRTRDPMKNKTADIPAFRKLTVANTVEHTQETHRVT